MPESFQNQIRAWAAKQTDDPPFAVAIRRLLQRALDAEAQQETLRQQPAVKIIRAAAEKARATRS
jgi:hypothetical protein